MKTNTTLFALLFIVILLFSPRINAQEETLKNPKAVKPPTPVERPKKSEPRQEIKTLQLLRLELTFDNGRYYRVVKKGESLPRLHCRIVSQGEGTINGVWKINNQVVMPLQLVVSGFQDNILPSNKLPSLPTFSNGIHQVDLLLNDIIVSSPLPLLRYFVSTEGPLKGLEPSQGEQIPLGQELILKWAAIKGNYQYQITVSQIPYQFLSDNKIIWQEKVSATEWRMSTDSYSPDHVYWMIRAVSSSGRILSTSEINYFQLVEKSELSKEEKEEVNP